MIQRNPVAGFNRSGSPRAGTHAGPDIAGPGSKVKVLFVHLTLAGGSRAQLNVLDNLGASFQPTLFLLKPGEMSSSEVASSVKVLMASAHPGRLRYALLGSFGKLLRAAAENDLVVGSLELDATYLAYAAARMRRRPVVGWVHTTLDDYLKQKQRWHRPLVRVIYPRLDRVVFVSRAAAASMNRVVRLEDPRVEVIPNSIDLDKVKAPQHPGNSWRPQPSSLPLILAVGRLNPEKGFDRLIRAHRRLLDVGVAHSLAILGEGPLRSGLTALVEQQQVSDSVALPGYFSDPYSTMKQASVLVVSSLFEGFSMVLLEALALGVPIVSTDCPGTSELLAGGRYGIMVKPNNEAALADAIARLLNDPVRRRALSVAGPARAREFSPASIGSRWQRLLLDLLEVRERPVSANSLVS